MHISPEGICYVCAYRTYLLCNELTPYHSLSTLVSSLDDTINSCIHSTIKQLGQASLVFQEKSHRSFPFPKDPDSPFIMIGL